MQSGATDDDGSCAYLDIAGVWIHTPVTCSNANQDNNLCFFPDDVEVVHGETGGSGTGIDNDLDNDGICDRWNFWIVPIKIIWF